MIYDLEDSVAVADKINARNNIHKYFSKKHTFSNETEYPERVVRVNQFSVEDVNALALSNLHGLVLPKVESVDCIKKYIEIISKIDGNSEIPCFRNIFVTIGKYVCLICVLF